MQENKNLYWEEKQHQQFIIVSKRTVLNPCLDFVAINDVHNIPVNVDDRNQTKQALQKYPIFLTDSDHRRNLI